MKRTLFALLALAAFTAFTATAQEPVKSEPRTITVSGNAERILPADRVRLSVSLRSVRAELAAARNASQEGFDAAVKGLGELGVPAEKIELSNHSLGREIEHGPQGQRTAKGFFSERDFTVELDDPSLLELVHTSLAENAEVAVNSTVFSRKDEIEVRNELRKVALEAAKEKASAMAAVYGQKVGKPMKMSEGGGYGPTMFNTRNTGVTMEVDGVGGRVTLNALVEVTFELVE
jgi:uncharacterized protein YggE